MVPLLQLDKLDVVKRALKENVGETPQFTALLFTSCCNTLVSSPNR